MAESRAISVLQLCPNDQPPFLDICGVYQAAAEELGHRVVTVFLGDAHGEPMRNAVYLGQQDLRSSRRLGRALREALRDGVDGKLSLVLCHRYRALQAFRFSGLVADKVLCVAHEFGFFRRLRRRLQRVAVHRQVRFAGVSAPVVAELANTVTDPVLLPNGIDLALQAQRRLAPEAALGELGLRGEDFNIAVLGRLHPKKQPQVALLGFALFAAEQADATLTFLGDGELMAELQNAAAGQRVKFAGFVPQAARCLLAFDVVLIPSGEREAFNMVALESMAAGVPVVAGPASGPRFVLGDVGVYFADPSPRSVAAALTQARALSSADGQAAELGRQRAELEFSLAATGARLKSWLS